MKKKLPQTIVFLITLLAFSAVAFAEPTLHLGLKVGTVATSRWKFKMTDDEYAESLERMERIRRGSIRCDELFDQWDQEAAEKSIKIKLPNPFTMFGNRRQQSRLDDDR